MALSSQVQRIIEDLTSEVEAELVAELARRERERECARERERLEAGQKLLAEYEAEYGPVSEEEMARVRREWPEDAPGTRAK